MMGLLGKKLGMAHVFDELGRHVAVTAVQAGPCTIVGVRSQERDGYHAVQLGFEPMAEGKVTKPRRGQFKKAGTGAFRHVREFRVTDQDAPESGWTVGGQLTVSVFQRNELVDVTGVSIGKGFQGGIKRHGWSGGPKTHGSMSHRAPGSIGASTTPGRVLKGHRLPGRMGRERVTIQNARIVRLDPEAHLVFVEGSVPGPEHGLVLIRKSVKAPGYIYQPHAVEVVEEDPTVGKKARAKAKAAAAKKK